jgi:hypothetical protein
MDIAAGLSIQSSEHATAGLWHLNVRRSDTSGHDSLGYAELAECGDGSRCKTDCKPEFARLARPLVDLDVPSRLA